MKTRLYLILAMLLATLAAQAATYYGFKIGGVSVNSDNYQNVTGSNITSGTVVYNPSSNTVTLTNVTIERTGSGNRAIYNESNSGLIVKLVGTNKLKATDAAPVRIEKTTTITVSSGTTNITGGSEGGIYINGAYKLSINGPGTLYVQANQKGGIEGSSAANTVEFSNVTASIFGGGGCLLDIYAVTFKANSYVHLYGAVQNVKNVDIMNFEGKEVIQSPSNALFNPSTKSVAYYDFTTNTFGDNVNTGVRIDDTGVVTLIDNTSFPDANFRNYLIRKFQKRYITTADVSATKLLSLTGGLGITNLQGIGYFTELESLDCGGGGNSLTSLDVSSCWRLKTLRCGDNKLTSLDLRQNYNLESVYCGSNQLTTLYLPLSSLTYLSCHNNNLTSLNLSSYPNLTTLHCYNNQLTTIDLSNNKKLTDFLPRNNRITGTGAAQMVNYLPLRTDDPIYFVFLSEVGDENELTFAQARTAHERGWHPQYYSTATGQNVLVDYNGVIKINTTNFPDANFRAEVTSKADRDNNGKLEYDEMLTVKTWVIQERDITNLKGIEYFSELETLDVAYNNLTSLDVSNNKKLKSLKCYNNNLTSLNVSGCTELETLHCRENQLQQLNLSQNIALKELRCHYNQLQQLNLSQNIALKELWCHGNRLQQLDLRQNTALQVLYCEQNELTSLRLSTQSFPDNTASTTIALWCSGNNLGSEAVDQFIASLDNRPTRTTYYVFTTGEDDQKMTRAQVQASRAKGWWPKLCRNGSSITYDYEGEDDAMLGDVNGDGTVDVSDVNIIVNIILGKVQASSYPGNADVDNSGSVDVSDVNLVVNIILGK